MQDSPGTCGICLRPLNASTPEPTSPPPPLPTGKVEIYQACGGMIAGQGHCAESYRCISDPRTRSCGLACDELGICVPERMRTCGGWSPHQCLDTEDCWGDPSDDCDPDQGWADCTGICLARLS
jgi:hypothetical protein